MVVNKEDRAVQALNEAGAALRTLSDTTQTVSDGLASATNGIAVAIDGLQTVTNGLQATFDSLKIAGAANDSVKASVDAASNALMRAAAALGDSGEDIEDYSVGDT